MKKVLILLVIASVASAQSDEAKRSPVYKERYRFWGLPLILYSAFDAQLVEIFTLMQDANAGKPIAQHDLAIRYLLGKGVPADTPKAIYWLLRAAERNLPLAHYNLGILHINGIGVPWNPFEAYKHFRKAAEEEIPEALFAMGVLSSENFIVPRNWHTTFTYLKRAAELGSTDAQDALHELRQRGLDTLDHPPKQAESPSRKKQNSPSPMASLIFLDFTNTDTSSVVSDTLLNREAWKELQTTQKVTASQQNDTAITSLMRAAEIGLPEALCAVGKMYENGTFGKRSPFTAALYYFRAVRLESLRAPALLWHVLHTQEFMDDFEKRTKAQELDALYLWAGITALQFSALLNEPQAFDALFRAASAGYPPAMVELGLCHYTGRWTKQNKSEAAQWFGRAFAAGNTDAGIRLSLMCLNGEATSLPPDSAFTFLTTLSEKGSLLALNAKAFCYEKGIYVSQNKGEAYRLYRKALSRGSETAYRSLQRMHNELRPDEDEFQIDEN